MLPLGSEHVSGGCLWWSSFYCKPCFMNILWLTLFEANWKCKEGEVIKKNGREQEQMKIVDMWIMNKWWGTRRWTGRRLKGPRLGTSDDDYNMTMKMWMGNERRGIYNDWENDWRNKNMEQLNEGIAGQVIKTGWWWGGKVIEDLERLIFDMIWWGICVRKW